MKPAPFGYVKAGGAAAAAALLSEAAAGAKFIAGGQSLGPMLNFRLARPSMLIDIARAEDMRAVHETSDAIVYGAAITHAAIEDGLVPDATPGWMAAAAGGIAYRAVRTRGTIGGSLAHADPAADWVNVLSVLGASVILVRSDGATRTVPLPGFFRAAFETALAPGEIISGVRVPRRSARARWAYWKFCRKIGDFSKASAAALIDPDRNEIRILVGAIERPPVLLPDPEAVMSGRISAQAALRDVAPHLDAAASALHTAALRRVIAQVTAKGDGSA